MDQYKVILRILIFSSVTQLCLTLCNPMNCSTPGLPVHHQLPESTQTHFHCISDAIQPSHPLSSPSPPALNLSQRQGLSYFILEKMSKVRYLVQSHTQWEVMERDVEPRLVDFRIILMLEIDKLLDISYYYILYNIVMITFVHNRNVAP